MSEEDHYNDAGLELVDWVEKHKDTVDGPMLCTLILDTAIDLNCFALGTKQAMKSVDAMVREKIRKYSERETGRN
tara:strand:+ start:51 stop:275 length:225 start_codon:yes stop_codon:yes gene_type:complete